MKKYIITLLFCTLFCHLGIAQGLKSVSILGDSYSTFEGYVQPDTNFVWYLKTPPEGRKTDMVSVRNTWWHQFIKENNYRLCVNNSFSGATICHTGYRSEDYSDRSFITRMKLGRTVFSKKVRGLTGHTPNEYFRIIRLKKAAELLLEGNYNVSEVSYKVGISDPLYFSRCFKTHYGVSPSVYLRGKEKEI